MIKKTVNMPLAGLCLLTVLLSAFPFSSMGAEKFDRGLDHRDAPVFMPKGQLMFGGTVSYRDYSFKVFL